MPAANRVNSDSFLELGATALLEKKTGSRDTRCYTRITYDLHERDRTQRTFGATRVPAVRGRARAHINCAVAEESPRSHVNHRGKMAPPCVCLNNAACTQRRRSGNARSMFEKRKRGSIEGRGEREWRCAERYTRE